MLLELVWSMLQGNKYLHWIYDEMYVWSCLINWPKNLFYGRNQIIMHKIDHPTVLDYCHRWVISHPIIYLWHQIKITSAEPRTILIAKCQSNNIMDKLNYIDYSSFLSSKMSVSKRASPTNRHNLEFNT